MPELGILLLAVRRRRRRRCAALRSRSYFKWRYAPAGLGNDFVCIIKRICLIHAIFKKYMNRSLPHCSERTTECGVKLAAISQLGGLAIGPVFL